MRSSGNADRCSRSRWNTYHRIINASSSPALLLAGTSAPNAMNLYASEEFIFNCSVAFRDRFDGQDNYFKARDDIAPDPVMGRAMRRTNLIPDVINCDLPLDNRRSPGYRRIEPHMVGNRFYLFVGQHETGRYSKAHAHGSAAVLICLRGKGYTYHLPGVVAQQHGSRFPMARRGKAIRVDYEPVGMVSAAPMSGDWFHQHFAHQQGAVAIERLVRPEQFERRPGPGVLATRRMDKGSVDIRDSAAPPSPTTKKTN